MASTTNTVRCEAIDWNALRLLLADEQGQAHVGKLGRTAFRLLTVVVYALPVVLALAFLGRYMPRSVVDVLSSSAFNALADATVWLEQALAVLLVALPLLLAIDLPLISKAYRQWRLSRRLVAFRLLDDALGRSRTGRWRWTRALLLAAPVALLGLFLAGLSQWLRSGGPADSRVLGEAAGALSIVVLLPAAFFLAELALRRLRTRLDYLREVMALRQAIDAAERQRGELPGALVSRLADVERARILRQSAAALEVGKSRADCGFALRKSAAATEVLERLPASTRMEIERALEGLAARQGTASPDRGRPTITVAAGSVAWRVEFRVDVARQAVEVIAVEHDGESRE